METARYGRRGSPWEFNLRDVFRWCELMQREQGTAATLHKRFTATGSGTGSIAGMHGQSPVVRSVCEWEPWLIVDTLYVQRMRTRSDRDALISRFREAFPEAFPVLSSDSEGSGLENDKSVKKTAMPQEGEAICGGIGTHPVLRVAPEWLQVGQTVLSRSCWSECAPGSVGHASDELKSGLPVPFALRRPLQALARYVS